jgi:hypothetical protein
VGVLAHSRATSKPSVSPVVSGMCAEAIHFTEQSGNGDNGMLIFTRINTLYKTTCKMLIRGEVLVVYYDRSFPS